MRGPRYDRILASTALDELIAASISVYDSAYAGPPRPPAKIAAVPNTAKPTPNVAAREPATTPAAVPVAAPAVVATPSPATTETITPAAPAEAAKPAAPAEAAKPAMPADTAAPAATPAPAVAAEPLAPPVDRMAALDPADRAVAEKIRDLFAAKTGLTVDKIFATRKERSAVEAFYESRNLAPLWTDKGVENARAKAVIARIKAAAADGLDLKDYKIPDLAGSSPDAQAEADLRLTQALVTFARHLQAGRFPFTRVSSDNIELPQAPPDVADILTKITEAADAGKALDAFAPQHPAYKKLKAALAEMRGKAGGAAKEIPDGRCPPAAAKAAPMEDPRVPLLREKLRAHRRHVGSQIRRQNRGSREEIPEVARHPGHRQSRQPDHQGAQRPAARPPDRYRDRQHGALALVPARPRQDACHRQPAGIHAARVQ
jgi:hypothetical protein